MFFGTLDYGIDVILRQIVVVVVLEVSCLVLLLLLPELSPCELTVISVFFTVVIFDPELSPPPKRPFPPL